jgi:steroid Delta-isomerase
MTSPERMNETVQAYIAAFDRGDAEAVADLFAADARVEDPLGSPPKIGREAILDFYTESMRTGARLRLEGPVRCVNDVAAFAFSVHLTHQGAAMRIDVIDTFRFDSAGKITAMTAYFGESNIHIGG